MDPQQSQQQAMHIMMTLIPIFMIVGLAFAAFFVFLFWRIFTKAGLAGPLALLVLIPGIGHLVILCILAFADWKVVPIAETASPYLPPVYPPPPPPPPAYQTPPQV
jgi:hypothetical protein